MAFHGLPLMTSYAGAKAAVRGFAQALAGRTDDGASAIRVSTVFPPAVNTPFFSHAVSHMGWPARPAPPVYQPEVVAAGIYIAATTGRAEMIISGTAAPFSLAQRISPRLIAWVMCRGWASTASLPATRKRRGSRSRRCSPPLRRHGRCGGHSGGGREGSAPSSGPAGKPPPCRAPRGRGGRGAPHPSASVSVASQTRSTRAWSSARRLGRAARRRLT